MNFDFFRAWCLDKIINIIVIISILAFILFIIFVSGISGKFQKIPVDGKVIKNEKESSVSNRFVLEKSLLTNTTSLSTKKIEWGIKRGDSHNQPDIGAMNKKMIEQYDGYVIGNNQKPYVYLTFDVGYKEENTNHLL